MIKKINGISLNIETYGDGSPLLLLHGFTGSLETWRPFEPNLSAFHRVILVDLIGHGLSDSPSNPERCDFDCAAADLNALLDLLEMEKTSVLGYSMGGRLALFFALEYPDRVENVVLESASPGLAGKDERDAREAKDRRVADFIEKNGVSAFVEYWEKLALFETQKKLPREVRENLRAQRLKNSPAGLAESLRGMGTGHQDSLWRRLPSLSARTLILAGDLDQKFCKIGLQMASKIPDAAFKKISGAGHAVHLERPEEFIKETLDFCRRPRVILKGNRSMSVIEWKTERSYDDILYECAEGIAKITINRPEVRNAFRPKTVFELIDAFSRARDDSKIGVVILTGAGDKAFCSGGDQKVRGDGGYVGDDQIPRLNVLDLQRLIRTLPKPVIAMVAGYAIGGGHVLHVVCDLTIAADNAIFGQTGPRVGSFDGGYGAGYLARIVGHKKAREIWFLCRKYDARQALDMGLVNAVVPLEQLEEETVKWAKEILTLSPTALRFLKAAFNADTDGLAGLQQLAGDATLLFYTTDEAKEGRDAFKEKRVPDFDQFPRFP